MDICKYYPHNVRVPKKNIWKGLRLSTSHPGETSSGEEPRILSQMAASPRNPKRRRPDLDRSLAKAASSSTAHLLCVISRQSIVTDIQQPGNSSRAFFKKISNLLHGVCRQAIIVQDYSNRAKNKERWKIRSYLLRIYCSGSRKHLDYLAEI